MLPFKKSEIPVDTRLVLEASTFLDITEYHLFELAYRDWFGDDPAIYQVEPTFVNYMFNGVIPNWVRQFARKTLRSQSENPQSQQAARFQAPPLRGSIYFLVAAFTVGILFLSATSSADLAPALQQCYFPPCY